MKDFIDVLIAKLAIWSIKRGYGCYCENSDLEDFPELYRKPEDVFKEGRCGSCRAKEITDWLEDHIKLIKEY